MDKSTILNLRSQHKNKIVYVVIEIPYNYSFENYKSGINVIGVFSHRYEANNYIMNYKGQQQTLLVYETELDPTNFVKSYNNIDRSPEYIN